MSEGLAFVCIWKVAENMDLRKVVFYPLVILHSQDIMEETVLADTSICNGKSLTNLGPSAQFSKCNLELIVYPWKMYENLVFGSLPFFHIC